MSTASDLSAKPATTPVTSTISPVLQRRLITLLGAAAFVVSADVRVVNPLLAVIANEFKTDIGSVGFIATAYAIPYGLFQLLYGPLGDRLGKLKVMTIAMALFSFGTAACAFMPTLLLLDLLRFITGATAAALIPLSLAYIGDNVPYAERQPALAKYIGAIALGQILSTSMGGIVADYLSWRYIFFFYGLISIGVFALMWYTMHKIPDVQRTGGITGLAVFKQYIQVLKAPLPRLVIITVFIEGFFYFGGYTYIGAFLRDRYHLLYIVIGLILSGYGVGMLFYSRFAKQLLNRLGEHGLMTCGGILVFLCYLAIALIPSWIVFILAHIVLGVAFNMIHNTLQTKSTEMTPEARGTAVSLFVFSLFIGQGIGAAVLGIVVDGPGYIPTFLITGVATLLLVLGFVGFARRYA